MRIPVALLTTFLVAFSPLAARAGCLFPSVLPQCPALKGLSDVKVIVSLSAEEYGLTQKDLEDVALKALRTNLPQLTVAKSFVERAFAATVFIDVEGLRMKYKTGQLSNIGTASVGIHLRQLTYLPNSSPTGPGEAAWALLWEGNRLLITDDSSLLKEKVRRHIEENIAALASDWKKANSGK